MIWTYRVIYVQYIKVTNQEYCYKENAKQKNVNNIKNIVILTQLLLD